MSPGDLLHDPRTGEDREVVAVWSGKDITFPRGLDISGASSLESCAIYGDGSAHERRENDRLHRRDAKIAQRGRR
jgi:hypothetical protein